MKKTILALIALTVPFAAQAEQTITYQRNAVVRFFGTKQFCDESRGEYEASEGDPDHGMCYIAQEGGNQIQITGDRLHVETLFGAANERAFDGKIVSSSPAQIIAREIEWAEDGKSEVFVKDGCEMKIVINGDVAHTELGETCDSGLTIHNAKLVK